MFKAVRDSILGMGRRIGGAWKDLRAKGMVTLFVFEFAVVLLGVLTAQGLQNWADERAATARLESALARTNRAIDTNLTTALGWQAATPCFRSRVEDIMRLSAEQREVPREWINRPSVNGGLAASLNAEDTVLFRSLHGDQLASAHTDHESDRISLDHGVDILTDRWLTFSVLDPSLGPVQTGDRINARLAGAEILAALRRIEIVSQNIVRWADRYGFEPSFSVRRLPRDCAEMWEIGAMLPEVDQAEGS